MKKRNKNKLIILLLLVLFVSTGCTKQLTDSDNNAVKNPTTGQTLTENILCKPKDKETVDLYIKNKVDVESLPTCEDFNVTSGGYEGLWTTLFVKPLAWLILTIGEFVRNNGLALIITGLFIRLVAYPITRKTAMQSELMKKAKPELDRLEKKYADKNDNESMMRKSQEMALIYKKYNINPISGCLFALLQFPLFIGFFEAINRVPAIFEENFLGLQLGTTPMTGVTSGSLIYIVLVVIVGLSTHFSLKFNSASNPDNEQVKSMNKVMFFMILFMSIFMSSALNIYWITTNLFTIGQNLLVKREKV